MRWVRTGAAGGLGGGLHGGGLACLEQGGEQERAAHQSRRNGGFSRCLGVPGGVERDEKAAEDQRTQDADRRHPGLTLAFIHKA